MIHFQHLISTFVFISAIGCGVLYVNAGSGGGDGFFFFAAVGGVSPAAVAGVMQSKLQNLFGKDLTVKPFDEPSEHKTIKCDRDLACTFKNNTCRWHNVKNDAGSSYIKDVYVGGGKPNSTGLAIAKNFLFGTEEFPDAPYGIIATQQQNVSKILFCSDPVPFPKPKEDSIAILKLRHWIMNKSTMTACIRIWDPLNKDNVKDMKSRKWPLNWIGCSQELAYEDNVGPTQLKINLYNSYKSLQSLAKKHRKSNSEISNVSYEVCLLMGPFPNKSGGLMFFDDITFDSGLCR